MAVQGLKRKTTRRDCGLIHGRGYVVVGAITSMILVLAGCGEDPLAPGPVASSPAGPEDASSKSAKKIYDSPEAVYEAANQAQLAGDWGVVFDSYTPESRDRLVGSISYGAAMLAASGGRDDVKEVLKKYGIDESMLPEKPSVGDMAQLQAMFKDMEKKQKEFAAKIDDKRGCFVEVITLLGGTDSEGDPVSAQLAAGRKAQADAKLSEVEMLGNKAKGHQELVMNGKTIQLPVEFRRIDGSWYLHQPAPQQGQR